MRIPVLALVGLAILTGCGIPALTVMLRGSTTGDYLVQERVIEARTQISEPSPLPLLPMDTSQRLTVQAGMSSRWGPSPASPNILDDSSGNHWQFHSAQYGGDVDLSLRFGLLQTGLDISGGSWSTTAGLNFGVGRTHWLAWGGIGLTSYTNTILAKDEYGVSPGDSTWWVPSRDTSNSDGMTMSCGAASEYGHGPIIPFLAAQLVRGPSDDHIDLSQARFDAGAQIDAIPRCHIFTGAGYRTFLSSTVHGHDWRIYAGLGFDLRTSENWDYL